MNVHKYPQSTDKDQHIHHSYHSAPSSLNFGWYPTYAMQWPMQDKMFKIYKCYTKV